MRYIHGIAFVLCVAFSGGAGAVQTTSHAITAEQGHASSVDTHAAPRVAPRLNYAVYGPSGPLVDQLKSGLAERFRRAGVDTTNKFPSATLTLYVIQDIGSNVNKSGVTVAIAYVSNTLTAKFAGNYLKKSNGEMPPLLLSMLRQDGFLYHLSAAHLDDSSNTEINVLLNAIVPAFLSKVGVKDSGSASGG